jgi:glutathione S-transferase
MKLYHCAKTRSIRVLWLLEELGLEYDLEVLPFDAKALQAPDYLKISPLGKVPVLVDDAVTMVESVAIVQYLLNRYGNGRLEPDRAGPEYGTFLQWLHFGESTMMGPISQVFQHTYFLPEDKRDPDVVTQSKRTFQAYAAVLDRALAGHDYLVGDEFSAADIVVGYTLFLAALAKILPANAKHLNAYYERLRQRPAFKMASTTG